MGLDFWNEASVSDSDAYEANQRRIAWEKATADSTKRSNARAQSGGWSGAGGRGETATRGQVGVGTFASVPGATVNADKVGGLQKNFGFQAAPAPAGEGFGPGFGETYGAEHIGQYDAPTDLETFAKQQLQGNNPYYDRLREQGFAALNQQMQARGHYNSGGALASLGNYAGALGAAQFKDMGDLLGNAGSMQMGRYRQGQETANSVQQQKQQRIGQQWGQLSDIAHLGAGNVGGFFEQGGRYSGDAAMAGINAGVDAAGLQGKGQNAFSNLGFGAIKAYLTGGGG